MNKKTTPTVTLIAMSLVAFFTVFIAIKQYLILREQVYQEAYLGINEQ